MTRYHHLAVQKYPHARIEGNGPFALLVERKGVDVTRVVLFMTHADAERSGHFYDSNVIQSVEPCPVPRNCPDRFPE